MKKNEIWKSVKNRLSRPLHVPRCNRWLLAVHGLRNAKCIVLLGGLYELLTNKTILTTLAFSELCLGILYAFFLMGANFLMGTLLLAVLLSPVTYYTIREFKRQVDMERLPFWERWETSDEQMIEAIEAIKKSREKS